MTTLEQIEAEIKALTSKREALIKEERGNALATCRELVTKFKLQEKEVFSKRGTKKEASNPAPPIYRDPETGTTWNGKGRKPKAMVGKDLENLKIKK